MSLKPSTVQPNLIELNWHKIELSVQDYVPDGLSDFAEALANPIKYQSELEKRSEQLAVLLAEDMEPNEEDAANSCKPFWWPIQ